MRTVSDFKLLLNDLRDAGKTAAAAQYERAILALIAPGLYRGILDDGQKEDTDVEVVRTARHPNRIDERAFFVVLKPLGSAAERSMDMVDFLAVIRPNPIGYSRTRFQHKNLQMSASNPLF